MSLPIVSIAIKYEHDVVAARQRARDLARLLGFDLQDQTRIATAVSEIARNAYTYAGGGRVEFVVEGKFPPQLFIVRISDSGPGINDVDTILEGRYRSETGMGLGIMGARRLMDQFDIVSVPRQGTTVILKKIFPRAAPVITPELVANIARQLTATRPQDPFSEMQLQNQELMRALDELRRRQEELSKLNHELEDTNRGVVALYAELEERADHLRRADQVKSKFLSNMSHEFRSPLNSILALTGILLDESDGPLSPDQKQQVGYVRRAAEDLYELVNDLLDTAKIEAGRIQIRPAEFDIESMFGALRGMLRPLLLNQSVNLFFESASALPPLVTDEAKVSQILRNFLSNALKFTERGEVRVTATMLDDDTVEFSVTDTGIGIAEQDQERIFEEFAQIEHPIQTRVKGTGLGLPLARKLARLLGGDVTVSSTPGMGSTFYLRLPRAYRPTATFAEAPMALRPGAVPILVVEDDADTVMIYDKYLAGTDYQLIPARTTREAMHQLETMTPRAIILDILLLGADSWNLLADLKVEPRTREIPIVVATTTEDQRKAYSLGADAYLVKPFDRAMLQNQLNAVIHRSRARKILIIDDNERDRYVLKQFLRDPRLVVTEASNGPEGLAMAREQPPDFIFLDLSMPGMSGFEVLRALKQDERTRDIAVIVNTSRELSVDERGVLERAAIAILAKGGLDAERVRDTVRTTVLAGA
jgi:signal transduction histidine kinase/DNA-binding response OmpR family regulator